jgi:AraC-like DNA-binding protein
MSVLRHERLLCDPVSPGAGRSPDEAIRLRSAVPVQIRSAFSLGTVRCTVYTSQGAVEVMTARDEQSLTEMTLGMVLEGETTICQAGRSLRLMPGQFAFYSASRPFLISAPGPHSYLAVRIPLFSIGLPRADPSEILVAGISQRAVSVSMLEAFLATVVQGGATMSGPARMHCGTAVVALVQAVILDQPRSRRTKPFNLFNLLAQWLEEHLTDCQLDAQRVAAAHHLSVRYVRQIFASQRTTVTRFVRERRLEHARADLVDPSRAADSVASIARQWRFEDPSVFSRAFRACYGMAPGTYREMITADENWPGVRRLPAAGSRGPAEPIGWGAAHR